MENFNQTSNKEPKLIGNINSSNPEFSKYICYIYNEKREVESYSKSFNLPSEADSWGKAEILKLNKEDWDYGVEEMHK
jgi:hypothetical protein